MPLFHDASPTWSGFSYQGKVGLYVVLKKLNTYNRQNIQDEFQNWKLEFEWLEDFSIKDDETYMSIHQVKAYNNRAFSKYKKAIYQLVTNSFMYYTPQINHYLHVITDVSFSNSCLYEYTINGTYKKHCSLNEIDDLIKEQIGIFISRYNTDDNNMEAIYTHFTKLLAIIDNHVRQRHQNIHTQLVGARQIECINFSEIIDSLISDSLQLNQERMIYEKKIYFMSIVDEFCQDKDDAVKEKINHICRGLLDLEDDEFINFIKSISPHIHTSDNNLLTIGDFQSLLQRDPTKDSFLESIKNIEDFNTFVADKYLHREDKKYLPTTINRRSSAKDEVCQRILENSFAIENLFEMDCFITERISCKSIEEDAYNTTEIRDEDLPSADSQEYKITELKKVEMMKIEDAERILNA